MEEGEQRRKQPSFEDGSGCTTKPQRSLSCTTLNDFERVCIVSQLEMQLPISAAKPSEHADVI